ncbi:MAG: cobalamin-binding protein, partial [Bacteroidota bacterium]
LIITQKLCDVCAVAEDEVSRVASSLPKQPEILNLEPNTLDDVMVCMESVGRSAGAVAAVQPAIDALQERVEAIAKRTAEAKSAGRMLEKRTLLLEWLDPPFSAGHWSPELVSIAGGQELLGKAGKRSHSTDWQKIEEFQPEVLVIACCGFSTEKTLEELQPLRFMFFLHSRT